MSGESSEEITVQISVNRCALSSKGERAAPGLQVRGPNEKESGLIVYLSSPGSVPEVGEGSCTPAPASSI